MQSGFLVNGEYANEEIMTNCHQVVCNKGLSSSFYQNHPTDLARLCSSRSGEMVSHMRNLPSRYETNLCKQAPYIPKKCSLSHGMLMALEGQSVPNLYASSILRHRDGIVESAGTGLFFKGGNPRSTHGSEWLPSRSGLARVQRRGMARARPPPP